MISKEVIATQQLSPVVETIFHWQADDPSHCLLRIFVDEQAQQAYVVASELYSNNQNEKHVSRHFEELAKSVFEQYPTLINVSDLKKVNWITHYGKFSVVHSFENLTTPDRFTQVDLPWPLPTELTPLTSYRQVIEYEEVQELSHRVLLEQVADILNRFACGH